MGPFASTDTLFPCTAGDLDLYTDTEISGLVKVGLLEPSIASTRDPHTASSASKVETALSIKKRDNRDSPCRRHPVSVAAGSHEDLSKLEHEHDAARKQLQWEIGAECGQFASKDLSHGLKRSGTVKADVSAERPRPKQHRTERGRSRECRHLDLPNHPPPPPYLFTPVGPSHPIRGSVSILSVDPSRGSSPPGKGGGTEVPIPTEVPPSHVVRRVAQSSG